jgi:Tol biopolymer transport system component
MIGMSSGRQDHMTDPSARPLRPLLAGAGALLVTGLLAAPAQAAFPGSNGRVVYERTPSNVTRATLAYPYYDRTELWTSNATGGDLKRLAAFDPELGASAHDPSVSPDGKLVAYVESGEGDSRIHIVGLDGTGDHVWRDDLDDASAPAWSPDGTKLVFVREGQYLDRAAQAQSPSAAHLVIGDAGGGGTLQAVSIDGLEGDARNPQWSPDGKTIAFDSNGRVYVVPASGGSATPVGKPSDDEQVYFEDAQPNWAPDGSAIIFERYVSRYAGRGARIAAVDGTDSGSHLIEVPFTGGAPRNADETAVIGSDDQPQRGVYSPDGLKLLYTGFRYDPGAPQRGLKGFIPTPSLVVAGADGSNAAYFVAPSPAYVLDAADWAPIPKPKSDTTTPVVVSVTPAPQGAVKGETTSRCGSRRNFVIRLRPRGARIAMARVIVNGKRVSAKKGKRWTAKVDLRTLPKKRFKVDVTVWTKDGRRFHEVRRYWTCTPAR